MTGFFNSNKNRQAMRQLSGYSYNRNTGKKYVTKKVKDIQSISFTEYVLKYGDIMLLGDSIDIIPDFMQHNNLVGNNVFDNIKADKIGIIWSPKFKQYLLLALNDDYTIFILWKSSIFRELPNMIDFDIDIMNPNILKIENVNKLICSTYSEIYDLTSNPLYHHKITEVFKR